MFKRRTIKKILTKMEPGTDYLFRNLWLEVTGNTDWTQLGDVLEKMKEKGLIVIRPIDLNDYEIKICITELGSQSKPEVFTMTHKLMVLSVLVGVVGCGLWYYSIYTTGKISNFEQRIFQLRRDSIKSSKKIDSLIHLSQNPVKTLLPIDSPKIPKK